RRQRDIESRSVAALDMAATIESVVAEMLFPDGSGGVCMTGGDARALCADKEKLLPDTFYDIYRQRIHDTIREELAEKGGNRQVAVNSFYVSRHLEVLSQTLGQSPRTIAQVAGQRSLLPEGVLRATTECLFSYSVGVAFGRWDIRYVTGDKNS